nr:PQQ-dependent sugar dehydrogenase [Chloroflexia bacterium]
DEPVVGGVSAPTSVDWLPAAENGDLLLTTQGGRLYRWNGTAKTEVLNISGNVCAGSETGLLGLAVDPQFQSGDRFVYLYYTRNRGNCGSASGRVNRISRFTMNGDDTITNEQVLIDNIPAVGGNHNGGDLQFGNDGLLYISVGDSGQDFHTGVAQDENGNARRLDILNGKILRIEKNGGIPAGNPFQGDGTTRCAGADVVERQGMRVVAQEQKGKKGKKGNKGKKGKKGGKGKGKGKGGKGKKNKNKNLPPLVLGPTCQEIFATGLRNPYRIAFDQSDTDGSQRFFINDVGGNGFEEINEGASGADYGWNIREGPCAINSGNCAPDGRFVEPLFAFGHGHGGPSFQNCRVVTGGAFTPAGDWPGDYLFADLGCATLFSMNANGSGASVFGTGSGATHIRFGPDGALYYTTYERGGEVRRIVDNP